MLDVFIKNPVSESKLDQNQSLQLVRSLYGLCESQIHQTGDFWYKILDDHHQNDLEMNPMRSDPAFYVSMKKNLLQGMYGKYVEDILRSWNSYFSDLAVKTSTKFGMADDY